MMAEIISLDYLAEYFDLEPSLFRESDNLHRLFQSIFTAYHTQQEDFLWLSQNTLNIDLAEKYHLDFIGNIVGQPRFLIGFNTEPYFGFQDSYQSETFGSTQLPFVGGYWNSRSYFDTASSRILNDEEYRRLIKARVIYNQSNCTCNDLLEVINLVTNRTDNTVQTTKHGLIKIRTKDESGFLAYFVDRLPLLDNILPIAAGVSVSLFSIADGGGNTQIGRFANVLEKLVNEDLPYELKYIPEGTYNLISVLVNEAFPQAFNQTQ